MRTRPRGGSSMQAAPRFAGVIVAAVVLMTASASALAAPEPSVRAEFLNGAVRVVLEGSYPGARYTVGRGDSPVGPMRVVGERDALCTGDCYVLDPDALAGATYWYRFDMITAA